MQTLQIQLLWQTLSHLKPSKPQIIFIKIGKCIGPICQIPNFFPRRFDTSGSMIPRMVPEISLCDGFCDGRTDVQEQEELGILVVGFVQFAKSICYKFICSTCKPSASSSHQKPKSYLSKLVNIFIQFAKFICLNWQMYLLKLQTLEIRQTLSHREPSKTQIIFIKIGKCICPNC